MSHPLDGLTEADIRARCSETGFERGLGIADPLTEVWEALGL